MIESGGSPQGTGSRDKDRGTVHVSGIRRGFVYLFRSVYRFEVIVVR